MRLNLFIEKNGQQTDYNKLVDTAKEIWKADGKKVKDIATLELYFNTDEGTCYYVINQESKGNFIV